MSFKCLAWMTKSIAYVIRHFSICLCSSYAALFYFLSIWITEASTVHMHISKDIYWFFGSCFSFFSSALFGSSIRIDRKFYCFVAFYWSNLRLHWRFFLNSKWKSQLVQTCTFSVPKDFIHISEWKSIIIVLKIGIVFICNSKYQGNLNLFADCSFDDVNAQLLLKFSLSCMLALNY